MMLRGGLFVPVTCQKRDEAASHVLGDQPEVAADKATRWVRLRGSVETLHSQAVVHDLVTSARTEQVPRSLGPHPGTKLGLQSFRVVKPPPGVCRKKLLRVAGEGPQEQVSSESCTVGDFLKFHTREGVSRDEEVERPPAEITHQTDFSEITGTSLCRAGFVVGPGIVP